MILRDAIVIERIRRTRPTPATLEGVDAWREVLIEIILEQLRDSGNELDIDEWPRHNLYFPIFNRVITSGRDHAGVFVDVWQPLRDLSAESRKSLCEAFDSLILESVAMSGTKTFLLKLLHFASGFGGVLRSDIAVRLVEDYSLDEDVRVEAARSLLDRDFRGGVPLSFWKSLKVARCSNFGPIVMSALLKHRKPEEALRVMTRLHTKPDQFVQGMHYTCADAIKRSLKSSRGESRLVQIFDELPEWGREFLRGSLSTIDGLDDGQEERLMAALA